MKPIDNTEDFVRRGKANVATDPPMDRRVLDDSFEAMDETIGTRRSSAARAFPASRATKLAALAAVIIVVLSLFVSQNGDEPKRSIGEPTRLAQSPAQMLSMMSLRSAYRQGGLDGLDQQFGDSLAVLGPRSSTISMQELLESFDGS